MGPWAWAPDPAATACAPSSNTAFCASASVSLFIKRGQAACGPDEGARLRYHMCFIEASPRLSLQRRGRRQKPPPRTRNHTACQPWIWTSEWQGGHTGRHTGDPCVPA